MVLSFLLCLPNAVCLAQPIDFEQGFMGFSQSRSDDFDWFRTSGITPSPGSGPAADNTLGTVAGEIFKSILFVDEYLKKASNFSAILYQTSFTFVLAHHCIAYN